MFTSGSRGLRAAQGSWRVWPVLALVCLLVWVGGSWAHARLLGHIVPPWDKLFHLGLYIAVSLAAGFVLGVRRTADLWRCFLVAALVGLADEGLQWFDRTRSLDPDDLLANLVGASVGTALHALRWRWRRVKQRGHDGDSLITRH
jgi:VanZ family protein